MSSPTSPTFPNTAAKQRASGQPSETSPTLRTAMFGISEYDDATGASPSIPGQSPLRSRARGSIISIAELAQPGQPAPERSAERQTPSLLAAATFKDDSLDLPQRSPDHLLGRHAAAMASSPALSTPSLQMKQYNFEEEAFEWSSVAPLQVGSRDNSVSSAAGPAPGGSAYAVTSDAHATTATAASTSASDLSSPRARVGLVPGSPSPRRRSGLARMTSRDKVPGEPKRNSLLRRKSSRKSVDTSDSQSLKSGKSSASISTKSPTVASVAQFPSTTSAAQQARLPHLDLRKAPPSCLSPAQPSVASVPSVAAPPSPQTPRQSVRAFTQSSAKSQSQPPAQPQAKAKVAPAMTSVWLDDHEHPPSPRSPRVSMLGRSTSTRQAVGASPIKSRAYHRKTASAGQPPATPKLSSPSKPKRLSTPASAKHGVSGSTPGSRVTSIISAPVLIKTSNPQIEDAVAVKNGDKNLARDAAPIVHAHTPVLGSPAAFTSPSTPHHLHEPSTPSSKQEKKPLWRRILGFTGSSTPTSALPSASAMSGPSPAPAQAPPAWSEEEPQRPVSSLNFGGLMSPASPEAARKRFSLNPQRKSWLALHTRSGSNTSAVHTKATAAAANQAQAHAQPPSTPRMATAPTRPPRSPERSGEPSSAHSSATTSSGPTVSQTSLGSVGSGSNTSGSITPSFSELVTPTSVVGTPHIFDGDNVWEPKLLERAVPTGAVRSKWI